MAGDYLNPDWLPILAHNGLADFDSWWRLEADWFEAPNQRRGGWSGVARCELATPAGDKRGVFLKRQENHRTFSWLHPISGIPTFLREFRHILHYRACGVPALEPVFFGTRRSANGHRAIIVTAELEGFVPLDEELQTWGRDGKPPLQVRRKLPAVVAALARGMHVCHIQHNCFYPKHIFVRLGATGDSGARVIDLEKSRWRPLGISCTLRDLDTLNRHTPVLGRTDRLRFLKAYLGIVRLTPYAKWLWRKLAARAGNKIRARAA